MALISSKKLEEIMKVKEISIKMLSEKLNVPYATLFKWLAEYRCPDDRLIQILQILDIKEHTIIREGYSISYTKILDNNIP